MRPLTVFIIVAPLFAAGAHAQNASRDDRHGEVALSNDTLQLRYTTGAERLGAGASQASASFFLSEERDIVLNADVLFPVDADVGRLEILLGPRAYAALLDEENNDVLALSLGTEVRLLLDRRSGLAVAGHAFYSPDILTFGTADNLTDLAARVEIGLAPRLIAFAGMRWFEFDLTEGGGERTLQEELFAGVRWQF